MNHHENSNEGIGEAALHTPHTPHHRYRLLIRALIPLGCTQYCDPKPWGLSYPEVPEKQDSDSIWAQGEAQESHSTGIKWKQTWWQEQNWCCQKSNEVQDTMNKGCLFTSLQQRNQLCPHCFVSVRVKERLKESRLYQVNSKYWEHVQLGSILLRLDFWKWGDFLVGLQAHVMVFGWLQGDHGHLKKKKRIVQCQDQRVSVLTFKKQEWVQGIKGVLWTQWSSWQGDCQNRQFLKVSERNWVRNQGCPHVAQTELEEAGAGRHRQLFYGSCLPPQLDLTPAIEAAVLLRKISLSSVSCLGFHILLLQESYHLGSWALSFCFPQCSQMLRTLWHGSKDATQNMG